MRKFPLRSKSPWPPHPTASWATNYPFCDLFIVWSDLWNRPPSLSFHQIYKIYWLYQKSLPRCILLWFLPVFPTKSSSLFLLKILLVFQCDQILLSCLTFFGVQVVLIVCSINGAGKTCLKIFRNHKDASSLKALLP